MEKTEIELLIETLCAKIDELNAVKTKADFDTAKTAMDTAKEAVNKWYVDTRAAELAALDVESMYKLFIDEPTANGVAVKQDKDTGKYMLAKESVKLAVPFSALVTANDKRVITQHPSWGKSISVLRYCVAECDAHDFKTGAELRNPLTPTADLYAYADKRGWSLHGKKDKDGHFMGVSRKYLTETIIPGVIADIVPESISKACKVISADTNYLLKTVCPAKSVFHNAKISVRKDEAVIDELFTVIKTRMHGGKYDYEADGAKKR